MTDPDGPARARQLFKYVTVEDWADYRQIMAVFAGTFFAEFTPDEVIARLQHDGASVDPDVVPERLESLRRWGNLTVSTSIGNPTSLADYYRRRNLYLITREGQEVHGLVEDVLGRVDQIADVESGRLRDLQQALAGLEAVVAADLDRVDRSQLADRVRAVFSPHEAFTDEITRFFAALNQWQSRYDLDPDDLQFFAEVLVGYVSEQLGMIERHTRPIAAALGRLEPWFGPIADRLDTGLAARAAAAGLSDQVSIRSVAGSDLDDWYHLADWFRPRPGSRSRIDELTGQAVAAVRTLTANLTRLSGIGMASVSRRADFVRLAGFFDRASDDAELHRLATAAFGLPPTRHLGLLAADDGNPVPSTTRWRSAPPAVVPVSLRERGDTAMRGRATPMRDRSKEKEALRRRRQAEARQAQRALAELLASAGPDGSIDGATLSHPAFVRLRDLIGRSSHGVEPDQVSRTVTDAEVVCRVTRQPGAVTTVTCPDGRLQLIDLQVRVLPTGTAPAGSP
jgi:uncharacterized protein (TIGR02677 family)